MHDHGDGTWLYGGDGFEQRQLTVRQVDVRPVRSLGLLRIGEAEEDDGGIAPARAPDGFGAKSFVVTVVLGVTDVPVAGHHAGFRRADDRPDLVGGDVDPRGGDSGAAAPWMRGCVAKGPMTAIEPRLGGSARVSPSFCSRTTARPATSRARRWWASARKGAPALGAACRVGNWLRDPEIGIWAR